MSTEIVIAREGDTVDLIAFRRFMRHGMEEAILAVNPSIADMGPTLTAGTRIVIPAPEVKNRTQSDRLWG